MEDVRARARLLVRFYQVKEESFSWDEEEFDMSDDRFWENVAKLAEDDEAEEAAKKARGG